MCTDESNKNLTVIIVDLYNQSVLIAFNIEHNAIIR
ncbi:hypothetical protein CYPRO_3026 [Cyclonatronum proteinivorum]|uniref:Uncharacterized protein n=1 Tax=Cyclonatronum proteinivorum TaxID=1457365 RepID=A0A345UP61_9BACT|nr:hypothetical protein CYPRO_3026 [Cyclonatronum proteinivorum]